VRKLNGVENKILNTYEIAHLCYNGYIDKGLLTIGEPMAVFSADDVDVPISDVTHWSKHTAGAELNVAVGVARLELPATYVSAVGQDPFGNFLLNCLKKANVNCEHIHQTDAYQTGIYFKEQLTSGDPQVYYMRKNSAAANYQAQNLETIDYSQYAICHLSGIFPAISETASSAFRRLIELLQQNQIFTTYDPNLRPTLWESPEKMVRDLNLFAKYANLIVPGIKEGQVLCGTDNPEEIVKFYFSQSEVTKYVIVKLGAQGAYFASRDQFNRSSGGTIIPGYQVAKVVDTVGAGDGFSVGLISALLEGQTIEDAVRRACVIGALAVTQAGDNTGYPTREELQKHISQYNL
jgi:2-dehydro-3-deoxygluconokinase